MTALAQALEAYGLSGADAERVEGGLINLTFRVSVAGAPAVVLQRLHPVFAAEVNLDIDVVTRHLAAAGLETPRLLRTRDGARWIDLDGEVWRALSHVDGLTLHALADPAQASAAGRLVGRFHRALDGLVHDYAFARAGVHDTARHLGELRRRISDSGGEGGVESEACDLGRRILGAAAALPALGELPLRHCHGDLKISNILFAPVPVGEPPRAARCLIDLDTLGRQTIAFELGDALRSWCNPGGEDVLESAIDLELFDAALAGYAEGAAGLLEDREVASIVPGLETVAVELAARFCVDVFDDRYFGWDPGRFASRREHNLARACGQLALAESVRAARDRAAELCRLAFTTA